MRLLAAALLFSMAHYASASCATAAYAGIAADVITTVGAVESGRGEESNPIYPDGKAFYPVLIGMAGLRAWSVRFVDNATTGMIIVRDENGKLTMKRTGDSAYDWINCATGALSWAAAGNNFAIWTGSPNRRIQYAGVGAFVIVPIIAVSF